MLRPAPDWRSTFFKVVIYKQRTTNQGLQASQSSFIGQTSTPFWCVFPFDRAVNLKNQ